MTEEEQEKLYELLFKDTKNKLEATIEKLRIANAELRDELDKKNSEIEEQQNKIASLQKEIKLMQSCDLAKVIKKQQKEIEELKKERDIYYYEWKHLEANMITKIKDLEEKNASLQKEIEALELIHETYKEVIEDIEDRYISKDKIREKIKELEAMSISQDIYYDDIKEMFEELLEEE